MGMWYNEIGRTLFCVVFAHVTLGSNRISEISTSNHTRTRVTFCNIRDSTADNMLKTRLIEILTQHTNKNNENASESSEKINNIKNATTAAACLYPCDMSKLCIKWSPSTHTCSPPSVRSLVYTTIACHFLMENHMFGSLPSEILYQENHRSSY